MYKGLLFLICYCMTFNSVISQVTDCCECSTGATWTNKIMTIPLEGITITIDYQERDCDGVQQMQILGISNTVNLPTDLTPDEIFLLMMEYIILNNPMNFQLTDPTDFNMWQFCTNSCWRFETTQRNKIIPCPGECCQTNIYVYMETDCNELSYELVNQTTIPEECDQSHSTDPDLHCYNVCYPFLSPKK